MSNKGKEQFNFHCFKVELSPTFRRIVFTVHCTVYNLYTVQFTVHPVSQFTVHLLTIQFVTYTVYCTTSYCTVYNLYTVQFTVHPVSVHFVTCTVFCTV